jgi:hypothetical protein
MAGGAGAGTPQMDSLMGTGSLEIDAAVAAMRSRFMQDVTDDITKISVALEADVRRFWGFCFQVESF